MNGAHLPHDVREVRAFNRFFTKVIGVLSDHHLQSPYSLTEVRVMYELDRVESMDAAQLRRELAIDAGYLSRILARFEKDGLVARQRSKADARRQVIALTEHGRTTFAGLDRRQSDDVAALLGPLSGEQRSRLVTAMSTIRDTLDDVPKPAPYVIRPPHPGDYGWIVARHGALYAEEYRWDETFEGFVARTVGEYLVAHDPRREAVWIAEIDGRPVGCIGCVRDDDATARLRWFLVEPTTRGTGIGGRLVAECLRFARRVGYRRMVLFTYDVLEQARRIYQRAGFTLVESGPEHSYGHDLVAQTWALDL